MKSILKILPLFLLLVGCSKSNETGRETHFQVMDLGKEVNVSCFEMEPNGSMWIGLDGQGLGFKESDGTPFTFYGKLAGTLPSDVVVSSYKDRKGRLWFGTFGNGMFYWDGHEFRLPENEQLKGNEMEYVSGFAEDKTGALWIATQKSGLVCCDSTGQLTWYDESNSGLATNWIADIKTFDRQTIYIATGWGLFALDTEQKTIVAVKDNEGRDFLGQQLVRFLCPAADGRLWIGARSGLYVYDTRTKEVTHLTTAQGLAEDFVKAIGQDLQGNIWVTSDHAISFVQQLEDGSYKCMSFSQDEALRGHVFHTRAIGRTANGDMLFGSSKGIVVLKNKDIVLLADRQDAQESNTSVIILTIIMAVVLVVAAWFVGRWSRRHIKETKSAPAFSLEPSRVEVSSADSVLMEKIRTIIEENMADSDFSVEDLSCAVGMSRGHLYKKVMALTGKSPLELMRSMQVKRGRQLLENGNGNISQIAWQIGLSPKQFSKYFKDAYGMLPSEFKGGKESG